MTSNPQSRRPDPQDQFTLNLSSPNTSTTDHSILLQKIDQRIRLHEIRVAIISASIGIPLLSYILLKLNSCS